MHKDLWEGSSQRPLWHIYLTTASPPAPPYPPPYRPDSIPPALGPSTDFGPDYDEYSPTGGSTPTFGGGAHESYGQPDGGYLRPDYRCAPFRVGFALGNMTTSLCPSVSGGSTPKWILAPLMVPLSRTPPCASLRTPRLEEALGLGTPLLKYPDLTGLPWLLCLGGGLPWLLCLGGPISRRRRKRCRGGRALPSLPSLPSLAGAEEAPPGGSMRVSVLCSASEDLSPAADVSSVLIRTFRVSRHERGGGLWDPARL